MPTSCAATRSARCRPSVRPLTVHVDHLTYSRPITPRRRVQQLILARTGKSAFELARIPSVPATPTPPCLIHRRPRTRSQHSPRSPSLSTPHAISINPHAQCTYHHASPNSPRPIRTRPIRQPSILGRRTCEAGHGRRSARTFALRRCCNAPSRPPSHASGQCRCAPPSAFASSPSAPAAGSSTHPRFSRPHPGSLRDRATKVVKHCAAAILRVLHQHQCNWKIQGGRRRARPPPPFTLSYRRLPRLLLSLNLAAADFLGRPSGCTACPNGPLLPFLAPGEPCARVSASLSDPGGGTRCEEASNA